MSSSCDDCELREKGTGKSRERRVWKRRGCSIVLINGCSRLNQWPYTQRALAPNLNLWSISHLCFLWPCLCFSPPIAHFPFAFIWQHSELKLLSRPLFGTNYGIKCQIQVLLQWCNNEVCLRDHKDPKSNTSLISPAPDWKYCIRHDTNSTPHLATSMLFNLVHERTFLGLE